MRQAVLGAVLGVVLSLGAQVVQAQSCRVALTLALDVSSSVDADEYDLQLEGLAAALEDRAVRAAIFQLPGTGIALQAFEWSGTREQTIIQDWSEMRGPADLDRMAANLRAHKRSFFGGQTALGEAIRFGLHQRRRGPVCDTMKIDVSGDGQSNDGQRPDWVYWEEDFKGVTVNGLAIEQNVAGLEYYYNGYVIRGPDAFVVRALNFHDYARAIRDKLIRELGVAQLGMLDTR